MNDIGSAIQQKQFRSEYEKLVINIIYTAARLQNNMRKALKPHGITTQQYNVLRILRGAKGEPISTHEIKRRMLEPMPDISRLVDRLVSKNLAAKCTTQKDKRLVDVTITQKGLNMLEQLEPLNEYLKKLEKVLPEENAGVASNYLDQLRATIVNG